MELRINFVPRCRKERMNAANLPEDHFQNALRLAFQTRLVRESSLRKFSASSGQKLGSHLSHLSSTYEMFEL